jgi:hypothetical protein
MAVDDVYPRRNLPGSAEEWGRTVESEVKDAQRSIIQISQDVQGQNRSTAASLEAIARQLDAIAAAQEALAEQQALLAAQQVALASTQTELANQVSFLQNASVTQTKNSAVNATRGASGGITLEGYDPTYDCSLSLTSSSTGILEVTVGGQLTGSDGISAVVGYEVSWAGGSIGVDWPRCAAAGGGLATTSRVSLINVPANTPLTVTTRRGYTGGTGGLVVWGYCSLIVSKVGQ